MTPEVTSANGVTTQHPSGVSSGNSAALPAGTPIPAERSVPGTPPTTDAGTAGGASGPPDAVAGSPGQNESIPSGTVEAPAPQDVTTWVPYKNAQYMFQVLYPPQLTTVEQPAPQSQRRPAPDFRVSFLDPAIANSPVANVAPPDFAVAVYPNPGQSPVEQWLHDNHIGEPSNLFDVEPATVGTAPAVRVTARTQAAPNVTYYIGRGSYVYGLTPLGVLGAAMLANFTFTP
jgi:hypothetical protein